MNKTELVNAIAENANLSKADAKKALEATLDAIAGALKSGDKIALVGFGTFSVSERPRKPARNWKTHCSKPKPLLHRREKGEEPEHASPFFDVRLPVTKRYLPPKKKIYLLCHRSISYFAKSVYLLSKAICIDLCLLAEDGIFAE